MISPRVSETPTRTSPRPRCFSVTSRERTAHEYTDSETESDDPGQYAMYRLPGLHGGVQIVERPAGGPYRFFCRRRLSEPARSRRQQLYAHYLQRGRYRRQTRLGVRAPALHAL